LLVIFDGFDEAGTLELGLTKQISEKLTNDVAIVLTSRDMGTTFDTPAFDRFRTLRVMELNEAQQHQVIERRLHKEGRIDTFCEQLQLNPALSQMAKNPLLLNVTLAVFEAAEGKGGWQKSSEGQEVGEEGQEVGEEVRVLNRGEVYSIALDEHREGQVNRGCHWHYLCSCTADGTEAGGISRAHA
jgi:hypothetical protein